MPDLQTRPSGRHICKNEYLAINSGVYLCTKSLHVVFAARLNASLRNRDDARLNRYAGCKMLLLASLIEYCAISRFTFFT